MQMLAGSLLAAQRSSSGAVVHLDQAFPRQVVSAPVLDSLTDRGWCKPPQLTHYGAVSAAQRPVRELPEPQPCLHCLQ